MTQGKKYHIHIEGGAAPFSLNLRDLWRYRDLIFLFTRRTIKVVYTQTILGPMWLFLNPLLTSVIYAAVFKGIAGMSTAGVPALLFYLTSHAMWNFLAQNLKRNASTFIANAGIFGKVYFPRLTISISSMLTSLFEFVMELCMVGILLVYHVTQGTVHPRWDLLYLLPVPFLLTAMLGLGLGILVSSVTTKYRDLSFVVEFGISLWMYASPVVYPVSQAGSSGFMAFILRINPISAPMELFRLIILGQGTVLPGSMACSVLFTLAALLGGAAVFNRVEGNFIDTI